jgi:hypothetical protein
LLPSLVQAARLPCGSPVTLEHLPSSPLTSQAWHCDTQVVSQQTPSTQWLDAHSLEAVHALPSTSFGAHPCGEQYAVAIQSRSVAHMSRQVVAPQTYGSQVSVVIGGHAALLPRHDCGTTAEPLVQLAERHVVVDGANPSAGQSFVLPSHTS